VYYGLDMEKKSEQEFLLGGQAVIEGVMMRSPNYYAVAVRKTNGDIVVHRKHHPKLSTRLPWTGWPLIRGVASLGQTLGIGISALNFSADIALEEEAEATGEKKQEMGGWTMFGIMAIAIAFAFGMIVFLPLLITKWIVAAVPMLDNDFMFNIVDGIFRLSFFLIYIFLISFMEDIQRVFQYHGAEHKAVHASEKEKEVTVDSSRKYSPYHPRCGTSFLLFVMTISILVFSMTPRELPFWQLLLIRTPLIPVIAGISYEVLRLTAKLSSSKIFSFLSAPGMLLQHLTAKEPDEEQLEVGVISLQHVIELEKEFQGEPFPAELELVTIPAGK
jgi:uncharacterized protein YqhQ